MIPTYRAVITTNEGETVVGKLMYVIVWEGKALSGGERLIRGDEICVLTVDELDHE